MSRSNIRRRKTVARLIVHKLARAEGYRYRMLLDQAQIDDLLSVEHELYFSTLTRMRKVAREVCISLSLPEYAADLSDFAETDFAIESRPKVGAT
jgi:hypothetical protein